MYEKENKEQNSNRQQNWKKKDDNGQITEGTTNEGAAELTAC